MVVDGLYPIVRASTDATLKRISDQIYNWNEKKMYNERKRPRAGVHKDLGKRYFKKWKARISRRRTVPETGVTYGSAKTYDKGYQHKWPVNGRFGKIKRNKFIYQLAHLQNPTQSVASAGMSLATLATIQQWFSLDFLKGNDVRALLNQNIPAGSNFALQQDQRLFLKSFVMNVHIQNTGTTPAMLEIYYVCPREDLSDADIPELGVTGNDLQRYITSTIGVTLPSPVAGTNTIGDAAGDSIPSSQTLGMTPFMMPTIVRRFVIEKSHKLVLPVNGTFTMTMALDSAKALDAADWVGIHYKKGISKALLFRVNGFPNATTTSDATACWLAFTETQTSKVINIKQSAQANAGGA